MVRKPKRNLRSRIGRLSPARPRQGAVGRDCDNAAVDFENRWDRAMLKDGTRGDLERPRRDDDLRREETVACSFTSYLRMLRPDGFPVSSFHEWAFAVRFHRLVLASGRYWES